VLLVKKQIRLIINVQSSCVTISVRAYTGGLHTAVTVAIEATKVSLSILPEGLNNHVGWVAAREAMTQMAVLLVLGPTQAIL
jgi:hypothetical protein